MYALTCKVAKSLLGEAIRTVVDVLNLSPSAPLDGDVSEMVCIWKDASYKHLKVFGCCDRPRSPRQKIQA